MCLHQTHISVYPKWMPICLHTVCVFEGYKEGGIMLLSSEQQQDLTQWLSRESQLWKSSLFWSTWISLSPPAPFLFNLTKITHYGNDRRWRTKRWSKKTSRWKIATPCAPGSPGLVRRNRFYSSSPSFQSKSHVLLLFRIRQWPIFPAHDTFTGGKKCRVFRF